MRSLRLLRYAERVNKTTKMNSEIPLALFHL
jgi:hypothetical protein